MDRIDQLLAVKTRLTTVKGYAQLLAREIDRSPPRHDRLSARVEELNREIERVIELVASIEASMEDRTTSRSSGVAGDDDYISSTD